MNPYTEVNMKAEERLQPIVSEFQTHTPTDEYSHYALTLLPKRSSVTSNASLDDLDARDEFVVQMYKYLDHRLMKFALPNYQRKIHESKKNRALLFIEHESKTRTLVPNTLLSSPLHRNPLEHLYIEPQRISHLHAVLAVHMSCEARILSLFESNQNHEKPEELRLRQHALPDTSFAKFFNKIRYCTISRIADEENLYDWTRYSTKESCFKHDFLNHARIYQHNY
jgi:hypothetical protein